MIASVLTIVMLFVQRNSLASCITKLLMKWKTPEWLREHLRYKNCTLTDLAYQCGDPLIQPWRIYRWARGDDCLSFAEKERLCRTLDMDLMTLELTRSWDMDDKKRQKIIRGIRKNDEDRSSVRVIPKESLAHFLNILHQRYTNLVHPVKPDHPNVVGASKTMPSIGYDVFISHATEDKDDIVRPLAENLLSQGLEIWYDEFELRIGDNLRQKIDFGLARSRFGIVVISPSFFVKNWSQYELDALVTREMTGEQIILPLWHRITKEEVVQRSPSLANKVARNTSDFTIKEIACEIADLVKASRP